MRIVADENMPFAREAFSTLGEVRLLPGRKITREELREADILAVRSVTRVGRELLEGTPIRFVGTATIGKDHIDESYLREAGAGFSSAPGCNAVSVAEYIISSLFELGRRLGFGLRGSSLGVIGVGNVGSRVAARAQALGMRVILNDPPLADETGDPKYRGLEEALGADVVTLHVPLEKEGPYPTRHLADREFISRMKPGAVLINSSRGAVAEGNALLESLDNGRLAAAVLDVWEGEPDISLGLLERVAIGTPHIAGYSFDGKARGTRMIYEAACAHFGVEPSWTPEGLLPAPENERIVPEGSAGNEEELVGAVVRAAYDVMEDDSRLRGIAGMGSSERPAYFDRLRREYPVRREWESRTVVLNPELARLAPVFEGLGFAVESAD